MSSYGLKTNIALNISILLFFGMVLTAFMLTSLFQKLLINSEIKKGLSTISILEEVLCSNDKPQDTRTPGLNYKLRAILLNANVECAVVFYPDRQETYEFGRSPHKLNSLKIKAKLAHKLDKQEIDMAGSGWGVFWKHKKEICVSAPIYQKNKKLGGVAFVLPLSEMFLKLRRLMKIIFVYIFINAGILTIAGVYQISKSAVKPVHRLLKKAEEYRENNTTVIFEEKTGNEFKRLSGALNNMLGRISDDKAKLQATVDSLEVANDELKRAQKDIVRAEKLASVGRLSSGIAHEIGNPLGIVGGYLELLKDDNQPVEQRTDFIERAEKELKRIDGIIRQLLDYSRKSSESVEPVTVFQVISDVVEMVRIQPFMNAVSIEYNTISKELQVLADYDRLKQVFLNLLLNAADALNTSDSVNLGYIQIVTGISDKTSVRISVVDNGPGIAKDDIGNVFDPFFTTKEPGKGTGLGLSVCFKIIEEFGGKLTIESDEGQGTRVHIDMPLAGNTIETG